MFAYALRVFLFGCASTVPTWLLEQIAGAGLIQKDLTSAAIASFVFIGPLEEGFKLIAVWVSVYRSDQFREPLHGIVFAVTCALGFVAVENIVSATTLGPKSIPSRIFFATPAHIMFSVMWGYSMGLARFKRSGELITILRGYILAALLHGTYDFIVAVHPKAAMISLLPIMVFMAWLMTSKIRKAKLNCPFEPLGQGTLICCPVCGVYTLEKMERCARCGSELTEMAPDIPRYCARCRARLTPGTEICRRCGQLLSKNSFQSQPTL